MNPNGRGFIVPQSLIERLETLNPALSIIRWAEGGRFEYLGKPVQEAALARLLNLGFEATVTRPTGALRITASDQLPAESHVLSVTCPHGFEFTRESVDLLDRLAPVFSLTADSVSNTHLLIRSVASRSLTTLHLKNTDLTEEDFEHLLETFQQRTLSVQGGRISEETIRGLKPNYPLIRLETDYGEFPITVPGKDDSGVVEAPAKSVVRTPLPDGPPGEVVQFRGHEDLVRAVAFSPDGRTVASTSWDRTVRLWDVVTKQQIHKFDLPQGGHCLAFSKDGRLVAGNYGDEKIGIWDVKSGQRVHLLTGHAGVVRAVAFSPTDNELASGSDDQTIYIWNLTTGKPRVKLENHADKVRGVVYSSNGNRLVSLAASAWSDQKAEIKSWNTETGVELWSLDGASGINCLCLGSDDPTIVCQAWRSLVFVYSDLQATVGRFDSVGVNQEGHCLAFHPDGRHVVVGCDDNAIRIIDIVERKEVFQFKADTQVTAHVAVSPDGRFLVSGGGSLSATENGGRNAPGIRR